MEAGISQAEVAAAVGLKQPDISKIETYERRVDIVEFLDILLFIARKSGDDTLVDRVLAAMIEIIK